MKKLFLLLIIAFPLLSIVITFPLWGLGGNGLNAQTPSWQWVKTEGGDLNTINNDNIDDEVLKIIPSIENDGSFIAVSRVMQTSLSSYAKYFDSTLVAKQNLSPNVANSTIVIAKHDCNGNAVIVKQIEDIPFYNNLSKEDFSDIVQINNKYYIFASVTNSVNDSALIIDTIVAEPYGSMLIVLDKELSIDTIRYNSSAANQVGPKRNQVRVGPDKNMYFVAGVYFDSATIFNGEPALDVGLSLIKMDTFGKVLNVHQLTDTVSLFGGGTLSYIRDLFIDEQAIYLSGGLSQASSLQFNGVLLSNIANGNGFFMKLDLNYSTIWVKQPQQLSTIFAGNSFTHIRDSVVILSTNTFSSNFTGGISFENDTVITYYGGNTLQAIIKIDPITGNKLSWDYPDGNGIISVNDIVKEDSILYLNYEFRNMFWQNLNMPTEPLDWQTSSEVLKNGIFKYNLNSGVVDTLTTYKFTYANLPSTSSNTSTMVKLGDNFIVGGNVAYTGYIGNDTIVDLGGTGSSLFLAKFGTSQCVFCDSVVADFAFVIDTFNLSFTNNSSNANNFTWLIDDSIILANTATTYNFIDTGAHTICLIAENTCSTDTFCQTINISCQAPQSLITVNQSGYDITLSNNSQNANSYSINWGDGTINTNLEHSYTNAGNYEICLVNTNFCGTDTACINVEIITGVEEQYSNGFVVAMYPNPAKEELTLSWQNIENQQKTIKIYNLYGQEMQTVRVENKLHKTQKMSLKNYAKGIYFVVLEVEGAKVWSAKLVVE